MKVSDNINPLSITCYFNNSNTHKNNKIVYTGWNIKVTYKNAFFCLSRLWRVEEPQNISYCSFVTLDMTTLRKQSGLPDGVYYICTSSVFLGEYKKIGSFCEKLICIPRFLTSELATLYIIALNTNFPTVNAIISYCVQYVIHESECSVISEFMQSIFHYYDPIDAF